MYEQEFLEPTAYINASSNPGVMRAVLDHVVDGSPLIEAHKLYLNEDTAFWRKSLKVCLADKGYANPEAQRRFAELARDLRSIDMGGKKDGAPSARLFMTEQAVAFRRYLAKEGLCDDLKSAYSIAKPEIAESQRKLCQQCIARAACAEYALVFNENHGMWGGMSERARRRTRRRIKLEFEVEDIAREIAAHPVDSKIRQQVRRRIPDYLALADSEAYRKPSYSKKSAEQPVE